MRPKNEERKKDNEWREKREKGLREFSERVDGRVSEKNQNIHCSLTEGIDGSSSLLFNFKHSKNSFQNFLAFSFSLSLLHTHTHVLLLSFFFSLFYYFFLSFFLYLSASAFFSRRKHGFDCSNFYLLIINLIL